MVLETALESWEGDRGSDAARLHPLVGTIGDPSVPVTKASIQKAAQADAALLVEAGIADLDPTTVTGHFLRRSGAKALARAGVALAKVQWMGRWGSSAVLAYVEEAAEEAPASFQSLHVEEGWTSLRSDVAQVLRERTASRTDRPAPSRLTESRLASVEEFLAAVRTEMGEVSCLARELDALVRPTLVLNRRRRVAHRAIWNRDPDLCRANCGWKWAYAPDARPITQEEVEAAGSLWSLCPRCFAS